jgi:acetolactate decarboxylase
VGELRPRAGKAIEQFSFVDALVAGLFEGAFAASAVHAAGDFGLGCGDALDGELVLLDGELFRCPGAGGVIRVRPDELVPFAEVARFEPMLVQSVTQPLDELTLEHLIDSLVPSTNLFYAIRVDGLFDRMTVRDAVRQEQPFRGLADAVKDQRVASVANSRGTMIGFRGPDVFQGLSVAEFHLHYLDESREFGGHVTDYDLVEGTLSIEAYASFTVHLPEVASYLDAALDNADTDAQIRSAEST